MNAEYYLYTNLKRILLTSRIKLEVVSDKPQGHVKMAQCIWGESLGGIMDYTAVREQPNPTLGFSSYSPQLDLLWFAWYRFV